MSVIAPTSPSQANPNQPAATEGPTTSGAIPGAAPGAKWVESADDLKHETSRAAAGVNPHPKSSEEADSDARKVAGEKPVPPPAQRDTDARRAADDAAALEADRLKSATPSSMPQRGNRNG